jgi:hypothetical protein
MTNEEKIGLFNKELDYFNIEDFKEFIKQAIVLLPDYFFEVPASSSGQFHSALESGFGGLVYHTKAVAKVANYLVNLEQYKNKLNEVERDCVVCAALLHDCLKHGWENKTGFSIHEHPVLAGEFVKTDERLDDILSEEIRLIIGDAIASHSGEWTTSKRSKTILPSPQTLLQELVHLSDYIASRSDIHILFEDNEVKPTLPDPNEYVLNFGKHSGKTLTYMFEHHRGYLEWCKENIKREPLISLIKQLEEQENNQEDDEI